MVKLEDSDIPGRKSSKWPKYKDTIPENLDEPLFHEIYAPELTGVDMRTFRPRNSGPADREGDGTSPDEQSDDEEG